MTEPHSSQPTFHVLVPLSDNEASARAQTKFVESLPDAPTNVEVTLTHVFHGEEVGASRHLRQTSRIGTVSQAREALLAAGIAVEVTDSGDPHPPTKSILTLAESVDADLIVLGGGMHSILDDLLTGKVAKSVGRRSHRPITVVPESFA